MKELRKYEIPFVGLKIGTHRFHYTLNEVFFEEFEKAPISKSDIEVILDFNKKNDHFIFDFTIEGTVNTDCDRCLENFDLPIIGSHRVFIKFDDDLVGSTEEAEIVYINRLDTHIDVAQLLYEFAIFSIPHQKFHPNDQNGNLTCNPEVLKYLNTTSEEIEEEENEEITDPRWAALKNLKK